MILKLHKRNMTRLWQAGHLSSRHKYIKDFVVMTSFRNPFEHMFQGLAYWLAYKSETVKYQITEAEAVGEAFAILNNRLPAGYKVKKEFPYGNISKSFGHLRADLAIVNSQNECECLIEFKLADSTNCGYKADVNKISKVRKNYPDIDCYVVIVYRSSCQLAVPRNLVDENGKSIKKTILINSSKVRVRRVCNAIGSKTADKMKKVVWLEVL